MMFVHVDCDSISVPAKEFGVAVKDDGALWSDALPQMCEIFEEHALRATFFVIAEDLGNENCVRFLRDALRRGHRVANHTWSHPTDFSRLSKADKRMQISMADAEISRVLGIKARGFRAPGYYIDQECFDILGDLDYAYDSSVLPGFGIVLMRGYFLMFNRRKTGKQFGRLHDVFASGAPRRVPARGGEGPCKSLWSIPIGVFPCLRLPMHSTFVFAAGCPFYRVGLRLCRRFKSPFVALFHGIDLLDVAENHPLRDKVPTLRVDVNVRRRMVREMVSQLAGGDVMTTEDAIDGQLLREH